MDKLSLEDLEIELLRLEEVEELIKNKLKHHKKEYLKIEQIIPIIIRESFQVIENVNPKSLAFNKEIVVKICDKILQQN